MNLFSNKYNNLKDNQPIGIFDSGIGGLTVAHAVIRLLPQESIIYFGDTARAPWGDKSRETIQLYSQEIVEFLLARNCKMILIACNTASAAAQEIVREQVGDRALVIDVIDPMIDYLGAHFQGKKIGLIGTKQTIFSNVYQKKLLEAGIFLELAALATPLLVPLVEEGFAKRTITGEIIREYLSHARLQEIEALILGCTHYPLLKDHMTSFYKGKTQIIDSAEIVALAVKKFLSAGDLINKESVKIKNKFFVSDYTEAFARSAELFFDGEVHLEKWTIS